MSFVRSLEKTAFIDRIIATLAKSNQAVEKALRAASPSTSKVVKRIIPAKSIREIKPLTKETFSRGLQKVGISLGAVERISAAVASKRAHKIISTSQNLDGYINRIQKSVEDTIKDPKISGTIREGIKRHSDPKLLEEANKRSWKDAVPKSERKSYLGHVRAMNRATKV